MGLITFTSDFGTDDYYVAAVKAAIYSVNPLTIIVDISHHIRRCDIIHAAFLIDNVFRDFPKGTVHLISVDTLKKESTPVAVELEGHFFVGFDCGIFSFISEKKPSKIVSLPNPKSTFMAKDCLVDAAIKLSESHEIETLGEPKDELLRVLKKHSKVTKKEITGQVVYINRFGNLVTNIKQADFNKMLELNGEGTSFSIQIGRESFEKMHTYYTNVSDGECFLLFNSNAKLEIGIKMGDASKLLGLKIGANIFIEFKQN